MRASFKRMFKCDSARILKFADRMFLIIGWNKTSKREWLRNGKPVTFHYLHEQVIASGRTRSELEASARHYKRLLGRARGPR